MALPGGGTGLTSFFEPAFSTFNTSHDMLGLYVERFDNSGLTLPLTANTMTRMIQISPGVAFAAVVLSPEWCLIATGDLRAAPAPVSNSASAADRATTIVTSATRDIEQLDLL